MGALFVVAGVSGTLRSGGLWGGQSAKWGDDQCVAAAEQQRRLRNRRVVLVSRARPVPGITLRRSRIQALPERRASGRFATGGVGKKPFPTLPRSYSLILGRLEIPPGFAVVDST